MDRNLNKLGFVGLGLAVVGLFLSFILILEYYGQSGQVGSGLCGAMGDSGGCQEVAESKFSALRGLPLIGDLPIAVLGFAFYGSLGYGFFKLGTAKDEDSFSKTVGLLSIFLFVGLAVDLILFLISLFIIKAVCSMCLMTYLVTIASLGLLFYIKKSINASSPNFTDELKIQLPNYAIAFLAFLSLGIVSGRFAQSSSDSLGSQDSQTSYSAQISAFESSKKLGIQTDGSSFAGKADAPITIVKFADFNCGHCMHASHILNQMLVDYDGLIKVVYMNFPLDGNCNRLVGRQAPGASSCVAATASLCGEKQGKFKDVYNGLYNDTENGIMHSTASVLNVASKAGLNMNSFRSCMGSQSVQVQIQKEVNQAEKLNIQSTPSIFINDRALEPGTPDPKYLKKLLDYLVKKA